MAQEFKGRPPRLDFVFSKSPLYFITFNTLLRLPLLACEPVHAAFRAYGLRGLEFHASIGRYVLMPDHVHLFVRISHDITLVRWETGLKQAMGKALSSMGHKPTQPAGQKLKSFWQPGFDDHLLRSDESYAEKWDYVWRNPVRAGFVQRPEDWPYQGKIFDIDRT